jgi:triphosphoribosyl-dephospho-CoA synthase
MSPPVNDQSGKSPPSIGQCAQVACIWEVTARKAGNVHRFADFADLTYLDFILSAAAIAPVFEQAPYQSVGQTVLAAVRATRAVVSTNTNLGIVLLLTPLAKACSPDHDQEVLRANLSTVLNQLTVEDARLVYEAIRLAQPGGLGMAPAQDVAGQPSQTLRDVMALAAGRDRIARQYACDFADVFELGMPALVEGWERLGSVEGAAIHCQLRWMAAFPDSLIARKRGSPEAEEATRRAREVLDAGGLASPVGRRGFAELDRWLRDVGHSRNPGTTADLVTACLFVALRDHSMEMSSPFPCVLLQPAAEGGFSFDER